VYIYQSVLFDHPFCLCEEKQKTFIMVEIEPEIIYAVEETMFHPTINYAVYTPFPMPLRPYTQSIDPTHPMFQWSL